MTRSISYQVNAPTRILTRPGQRPDPDFDPTRATPSTRILTRFDDVMMTSYLPGPMTSCWRHPDRILTRPDSDLCAFRRPVRARPTSVLDDLGTDALVSKCSTMWYIYFTCLKLLQIRKYVKNSMYAYFLGYFCVFSCISLWFWKYV